MNTRFNSLYFMCHQINGYTLSKYVKDAFSLYCYNILFHYYYFLLSCMWTYSLRKGTDIGVPKIKFARRAKPGTCLMRKLSGTSWRSGEEGRL